MNLKLNGMQINNKEILILVSFEEQDKEYFEHIIRNLSDRAYS